MLRGELPDTGNDQAPPDPVIAVATAGSARRVRDAMPVAAVALPAEPSRPPHAIHDPAFHTIAANPPAPNRATASRAIRRDNRRNPA